MSFSRISRVQNVIKQELAQIIDHELDNPNLPEFITVYNVKVTTDLRHANVEITFMDDTTPEVIKQTIEELNKAAGFIRRLLTKRVELKRHPDLHFAYNGSTKYALDMAPIFHQLEREHPAEERDSESQADSDAR
jgi:ribosome-binding factor A